MTHQLPRYRGQDIGVNDQPVNSGLEIREPILLVDLSPWVRGGTLEQGPSLLIVLIVYFDHDW